MPRRPTITFIPMLLALLLAACGGGGGDSNSGGTTGSPSGQSGSTGNGSTGGTTGTGSGSTGGTTGGATGGTTAGPRLATATSLADGTTVGTSQWSDGSTPSGGQGQAVGSLACGQPSGTGFGYAHLSIIQNGTQLAVPANIGVVAPTLGQQAGCVYPLHTRDASGKIRIDSSASAPTLGQFFSVWGQPLSASGVGGLNGTVTAYVNNGGTLTQYNGDPSAIPLAANSEITLVVGTVPSEIPTYRWSDPPALNTTSPLSLNGTQIGASTWPAQSSSGGQGQTVDGLPCTATMAEDFHVHTHLAIIRNGQMLAIPSDVGIISGQSGCYYPLHTHNASGEIHVESATAGRFTLGQFFKIWGQPLSSTNVGGFTGEPVKVYINDNGDLRQYIGDPAQIELASHRSITIQIGTEVSSIPTYSWDTER